jgi:hypothetical protein
LENGTVVPNQLFALMFPEPLSFQPPSLDFSSDVMAVDFCGGL